MTPQEALEVVDRAASQVQAVRVFHEQVVSAIRVLSDFVQVHSDVPNDTQNVKTESTDPDPDVPVEDEIVE